MTSARLDSEHALWPLPTDNESPGRRFRLRRFRVASGTLSSNSSSRFPETSSANAAGPGTMASTSPQLPDTSTSLPSAARARRSPATRARRRSFSCAARGDHPTLHDDIGAAKSRKGDSPITVRMGNCSGQFVIPICGTSHELNRFPGFNHWGRNRADMGANAVPACQRESSDVT